jgi:hypothetical protein
VSFDWKTCLSPEVREGWLGVGGVLLHVESRLVTLRAVTINGPSFKLGRSGFISGQEYL